MRTKVSTNTSYQKTVSCGSVADVLESDNKEGIKHVWTGYVDTIQFRAHLTWKFDWEELKNQGVHRLVGHLIVQSVNGHWHPYKVNVDWTDTNHSILATLGGGYKAYDVKFEYNLTAHYAEVPPLEKVSFDEMFVASDKTDTILIVEGKKLNVNKAFLSFHSDYFSTLFSVKFKEGQMKQIEIKEVSYEDFGLLLASFYPNHHFPNDHTVEKLLEMARRFQVLSVIRIVEHHLLYNSTIEYEKILWFADEYTMPKLLEKCLSQMNSLENAKKLKKSPEFEKLSVNTRSLILGRLLEVI